MFLLYSSTIQILSILVFCFLISIFVLPIIVLRCICWYLSWKLNKRDIKFRVQKVGYFSLKQIKIQLPRGSILEIENLWISSNLFNAKCKTLITICVSDLRFQGDFLQLYPTSNNTKSDTQDLNFKKWVNLLALFKISVLFSNASAMQLGATNDEFLFHMTLQELTLHLNSTKSNQELNGLLTSITIKVFQHYQSPGHSCLAQFSVTTQCTLGFSLNPKPKIETINISILQPEILLYEEILFFPKLIAKYYDKPPSHKAIEATPSNTIYELLSSVPQSISLGITDTSIRCVQEGGHRTLSANLKELTFIFSQQLNSKTELVLTINSLGVSGGHTQLLTLNNLKLNTKLTEELIEFSFLMSSFHFSPSMETLLSWPLDLNTNSRPQSSKALNCKQRYLPLVSGHTLNCTVELKDTQFDFKFADTPTFILVCNKGKWSMNSILESGGSMNDTNMEILLENVSCSVGEPYTLDLYNLKKYHFWTMPLVIGVALIQIKQNKNLDFKIEAMLDNVQFEWNMIVCSLLKKLCLPKVGKSKNKSVLSIKPSFSLQVIISNTNLFFLTEKSDCVMLRLDNINLDTHKKSFSFEGTRAVQVGLNSKSVPCIKSSEVKNHILCFEILRFTINNDLKEYTIQILGGLQVEWSTNLHMCLLTLYQAFPFEIPSKTLPGKRPDTINKYNIIINGPINFKAIISRKYSLFCHLNELNIQKYPYILNLSSSEASIGYNMKEIFYLQNFKLSSSQETEKDLLHRRIFEELKTKTNKVLDISIEEIKLAFAYEFNFAEAFTEQTISIIKWLKIVHQLPKSITLAPDVIMKIKLFSFELPDDPFEVKLRDNYVLLKDEYLESLERKKMLDEKMEQLRKTNLLLPTAKLDEIYSSLAKKNADIYVKRSRQLYNDSLMRTSISLCSLEDVEFIILADTSFHGQENISKIIQELDSDSPYPEEGIEFSTLWCRMIKGNISNMVCHLRNFPQPYLEVRELHIWGRLAGAEQVPNQRSRRFSLVEITEPWEDIKIERSMQPLKFFHDLKCDMQSMCAAYGPCWEPIMSQVSLAYEYISRTSLDPSPPLAWWDKMRLLYHGRFSLSVQHMIFFLHASLDPYNTTEEMEITWTDVIIDWTNGKILTRGDLDVYVHTASKYDDCRLLHMPNLKFGIKLDWLCIGNPNDHFSISPCAPDKVPEYSINQTHDSFRAFRSQNLSLALTLESKVIPLETTNDVPTLLLFSSTLRWFENLKLILSGVTRLTRRGKLFENIRPRKPPLSRHYSAIRLSLNIHKSQICYWTSFAKNKGLELLGGRFSLSSEHSLSLVLQDDGLVHRHQPNWTAQYMNCDLGDSEMWLSNSNVGPTEPSSATNINRTYFFSVNRVSYGREANVKFSLNEDDIEDTPTHRLVIHGLKGAWIESNRDVIFSMFDSYVKGQQLKRNLATDALKSFKVENCVKPTRSHANSSSSTTQLSSPCTSLKADSLLQKLVAEAEASPSMVYTEEIENTASEQELYGVLATQTDDMLYKNWLIELVNSQVMLKGSETSGYVIVSASKTQILQRIHQPTWKERTLYSKTTWVGSLECMQYYATVDVGEPGPLIDNIMWLSVDNIEEKESMIIADIPDMVGSGHSVGGIVSNHVGGSSDPSSAPLQLQRIVSRCGCQFYYASYGENLDQHSKLEYVPPLPEDSSLLSEETCVDSFALAHHDLNICTNSSQYSMILDIVNNLLLYVEPRKKEARENLQRMRFRLQLCSIEDQRKPILQIQNQLRTLLFNLKNLEKEAYQLRLLGEKPDDEDIFVTLAQVESDINRHKEIMNNFNDELTMMISCYKETQMSVNKTRQRSHEESASTERHNQVCFKHAQWRLTDKDGQLGIADLILSNFIYSKISKSNDSVEHLLELGYVKVTNLLPNQIYKDVLQPTELQPNIPLDRKRALRIFCRENAPVGGISVKEHLEVNVVPITLSLTKVFYMEMMRFFFPGRDTEKTDDAHNEDQTAEASGTLRGRKQKQRGIANTLQKNDIEKMKERAKKNQTFLYIKIPQVPIKVSFKGDKNIEDLRNSNLVLPTLEYHNRTWTWLDLFLELKSVSKKVLLPQAIKQKIQILKTKQDTTNEQFPQDEEEKAVLLFGSKLVGAPENRSKKGFFHKLTKQ